MGETDGQYSARFRFFGNLNDFLPKRLRGQEITYTFRQHLPALKDAIEALGVPHPEADVLLQNVSPASLSDQLLPNAQVQIYPAGFRGDWPAGYSFLARHPAPARFVLDVHLGTLTRRLRLLGLDTLYRTDLHDDEIATIAQEQQRVVLTRDIGLLKQRKVTWGYWLRSQDTEAQLQEVVGRFNLQGHFAPLALCLNCNKPLRQVPKQQVLHRLPPKTRAYFEGFYTCPGCEKVYWKGSHYLRMQHYLKSNWGGP